MDEIKMNLGSKFMRKIAAKIIKGMVKKHFGVEIKIDLEELNVKYNNGDVILKTNVELQMDRYEFKKLISNVEEDFDV